MTTAVEPVRAEQPWWRPMVAAMSKTGGGAIASGLFSALATKIVAAQLGPGAIALLATLQQIRDGAVTVATSNGRTALVQGASALSGEECCEYVRTVAMLFGGGAFLVAALMLSFPSSVARWSRLPASSEILLPWLALTAILLSAFVFLTGILNALREIGKLALLQVTSPLVAAIVAWPVTAAIRGGHPVALILFLAIPAAATLFAATLALRGHRRQLRDWFQGSGRWFSAGAARGFLSISGAMLVSGLAATIVLLAVRGSVTRREGSAITGQFDAAWNISMNQVTLLLSSVQAYYLPTLAAAKSVGERGRQIRGMLLITTVAAVPPIVLLAALKPLAVSILYSNAFHASPAFLRWTLLGDYLKVSAWVLATPMLATRDVAAFLGSDLLMQAIFLGSAMLLARFLEQAEGVAIGFLISYAVYFAVCWAYARSRHGFRFGAAGLFLWLTGLAVVSGASATAWSDTAVHLARSSFWVLLSLGFSGGFAVYLRRREA